MSIYTKIGRHLATYFCMRRVSLPHRAATTDVPLLPSSPGGLEGSWPCRTYPGPKLLLLFERTIGNEKNSLNLHVIYSEMEEQEGPKVIKIHLIQAAMSLGTHLGAYVILVYLSVALSVKYSGITFITIPLILGVPVIAYRLVSHFRDENKMPFFPFPISWIITFLMFLFSTVLSCMVAYLYLRFIDHGAFSANVMTHMEAIIQATSETISTMTDPVQIEHMNNYIEFMRQNVTWFCSLPASGLTKQLIQQSLMWGNILSIIIALITAKRIRIK